MKSRMSKTVFFPFNLVNYHNAFAKTLPMTEEAVLFSVRNPKNQTADVVELNRKKNFGMVGSTLLSPFSLLLGQKATARRNQHTVLEVERKQQVHSFSPFLAHSCSLLAFSLPLTFFVLLNLNPLLSTFF